MSRLSVLSCAFLVSQDVSFGLAWQYMLLSLVVAFDLLVLAYRPRYTCRLRLSQVMGF